MRALAFGGLVCGAQQALRQIFFLICLAMIGGDVAANGSGTIYYTQRWDGPMTIVNRVDWNYVRGAPSLGFSNHQVIWTGLGAQVGMEPPMGCDRRLAGSDGVFFTPARELVVGCRLPFPMDWNLYPPAIVGSLVRIPIPLGVRRHANQ